MKVDWLKVRIHLTNKILIGNLSFYAFTYLQMCVFILVEVADYFKTHMVTQHPDQHQNQYSVAVDHNIINYTSTDEALSIKKPYTASWIKVIKKTL